MVGYVSSNLNLRHIKKGEKEGDEVIKRSTGSIPETNATYQRFQLKRSKDPPYFRLES
jgi:hypothetical protein